MAEHLLLQSDVVSEISLQSFFWPEFTCQAHVSSRICTCDGMLPMFLELVIADIDGLMSKACAWVECSSSHGICKWTSRDREIFSWKWSSECFLLFCYLPQRASWMHCIVCSKWALVLNYNEKYKWLLTIALILLILFRVEVSWLWEVDRLLLLEIWQNSWNACGGNVKHLMTSLVWRAASLPT